MLIGLFHSCQKDNNNNNNTNTPCNPPPASTFKYKFNGTLIECNGSLADNSREGSLIRKEQGNASSSTVLTNTSYIFSILATKNYYYSDDGEPILEIEINSPTLTNSTYSHTSNGIRYVKSYYPSQSEFCGYCTPSSYVGQEFTVTITKIENGYADGTFSGKLKKTSGFDIITEGEFKSVKVIQ